MNKAGFCQAKIGQSIGFEQSTVSKELSGKRGYRSKQADDLAKARQKLKRTRPKVITGEIKEQDVVRRMRAISETRSDVS